MAGRKILATSTLGSSCLCKTLTICAGAFFASPLLLCAPSSTRSNISYTGSLPSCACCGRVSLFWLIPLRPGVWRLPLVLLTGRDSGGGVRGTSRARSTFAAHLLRWWNRIDFAFHAYRSGSWPRVSRVYSLHDRYYRTDPFCLDIWFLSPSSQPPVCLPSIVAFHALLLLAFLLPQL